MYLIFIGLFVGALSWIKIYRTRVDHNSCCEMYERVKFIVRASTKKFESIVLFMPGLSIFLILKGFLIDVEFSFKYLIYIVPAFMVYMLYFKRGDGGSAMSCTKSWDLSIKDNAVASLHLCSNITSKDEAKSILKALIRNKITKVELKSYLLHDLSDKKGKRKCLLINIMSEADWELESTSDSEMGCLTWLAVIIKVSLIKMIKLKSHASYSFPKVERGLVFLSKVNVANK